MTSELSKAELMELFNIEVPKHNERLAQISAEMEIRQLAIDEIGERIARGGVRTIEEANELIKDLENHKHRVEQLEHEAEMILSDVAMDVEAIVRKP